MRRTNLAARIPEPAIRARAPADSRGMREMPPVRGSGLAEALIIIFLFIFLSIALALIISSSIALALDIALAEAEALDIALALAEELLIIMSSSIILSSFICATAAGAKTTATSKASRLARANLRMGWRVGSPAAARIMAPRDPGATGSW